MAVPRFNAVDFRLKSTVEALIAATPGLAVPGFGADAASANWADWPFGYADLEPFYAEAEHLYGVAGLQGDNVYESFRSRPYPMAPGVPMYMALRLAEGARSGSLAPGEIRGSTFTVTSAGKLAGLFQTPIVNHPEVAILSVGRIAPRPVVRDEKIVVRRIGTIAVTFDHRVIDGARAAAFGLAVIQRLESRE